MKSISPFKGFPFRVLGLTLCKTFLLKVWTCSTNSGLSWSRGMSARLYSWLSLVRGLIIVWQSRSLKKDLSRRRILFFLSIASLKPFYCWSAFSRYSREDIGSWSASTSCKVKSRTTQRRAGKYWAYSSGSVSSLPPPALIWMFLVRLMTSERSLSFVSSMDY